MVSLHSIGIFTLPWEDTLCNFDVNTEGYFRAKLVTLGGQYVRYAVQR
jgi:hypothetical protein